MNIPMSWLKAYVDLDCSTKEYMDRVTMSGTKVETMEETGAGLNGVVTGKIISIEKHPDADKLVITKADVGQEAPVQIVTGATNLYEGAYVPVALDGSTLHGGLKIKRSKLRGVESQGMLCSVEELGYTRQEFPEAPEDGIYIFQGEVPLGVDAVSLLEIKDEVVEYEITSNRSDCNSVVGVAREAAATFNKEFNYPDIRVEEKAAGNAEDFIDVEILNSKLCPRYACRVIKNVKIGPSPQWMRMRLAKSGVRPINNIVDITNYVMLELGQPMHAFDIDNIDERKIIVRNARDGEAFTTLDGNERQLDPSMLVIADCNKAVAVAGVMGGENSKVTENATAILFESANFNGANIRLTSKKLGLRTDASSRYEKGIDPNLVYDSVNRAAQLVEELGCGEVVKGIRDCYPNKREKRRVEFDRDKINALLGADICRDDMIAYLSRLEIQVEGNQAIAPTFRPDLECLADISEEVARIYGYDKINTVVESGLDVIGKRTDEQIITNLINNAMTSFGYYEIMNYSFESPKVFDKLKIFEDNALKKAVRIMNPLGEDFSVMRTTLLNGLLQSLSTNYNRKNEEAFLFEMAKTYKPKALPLTELPDEPVSLTFGFYGKQDFFDAKGTVEGLIRLLNIKDVDFLPEKDIPYMHPGRCARVIAGKYTLGYVGEAHPDVCENYEIGAKVYLGQLDLETMLRLADMSRSYQPLPRYPAVIRDLAMLSQDDILVRDIEKAIQEKGGRLLESAHLFDVYKGEQIRTGYKSVAFNLIFRDSEKTLTEEEVDKVMDRILAHLKDKLGVELR